MRASTDFDAEAIPQEMIEAARWVNWEAVQRDGRWTKVPLSPHGGAGKSNDPTTWGTFAQAVKRSGEAVGVGFCLGDGWLGVDFDHLDEEPELAAWVTAWMERHPGVYVETSASGTGIHAVLRGVQKPAWAANRRGRVELYERARFFVVTGKAHGRGSIGGDQAAVDDVAERWLRQEPAESLQVSRESLQVSPSRQPTDDPSAADWSLCCDLAQRGFRRPEIAARLVEKMEREGRHQKAARADYIDRTVGKALSAVPAADAPAPLAIKPLADVITENPTKTPYVVQRLLRRGEVMAVIAPPKCRKSFLMADLAIAAAVGGDWAGQFRVQQGRALLVDNELSHNEIADRTRAILGERGVGIEQVRPHLDVLSLRDSADPIDELLEKLEAAKGGWSLVVFDALYMFLEQGQDENSNADMAVLLRRFRNFASRTGAAVALVHHTSKGAQSGKDALDLGAGAGSLARAVDTHVAIYRHEEEGAFVAKFNVRSSAPIGDLGLKWAYPCFSPAAWLDLEELHAGGRKRSS